MDVRVSRPGSVLEGWFLLFVAPLSCTGERAVLGGTPKRYRLLGLERAMR